MRRSPLPPGALAVGGGLVVASATTYGFLAVAARALGPERYAPISVLWSALFLVVPTVWTPVEQEVARQLSSRGVAGQGGRPVVLAGARAGAQLGVPVLAVLAIAGWFAADQLFAGQRGVALALVAAVVAFAPNHLTRAALAGAGSFGRYGLCITIDSATRLLVAGVLFALGIDHALPYALAVVVGPLIPVLAFRRQWGPAAVDGPPVDAPLLGHVLTLAGAQAGAQLLINGGPLVVAALARPGEEAVASRFLTALLVARIPLFFFQAVQSSLLPGLARLSAADDRDGFIRQLRRLGAAVAALTATAVVAAWWLGPWVIRLAFGAGFVLPGRDLALLAGAAGCFMAATVLAHAVIARSGHRRVTLGWVAGVVTAVVVVAAGDDLVWRVAAAMAAGALVTAFAQFASVRRVLGDWAGEQDQR